MEEPQIRLIRICSKEKFAVQQGHLNLISRMKKIICIDKRKRHPLARIHLRLVSWLITNNTNFPNKRSQIDLKVPVQARNSLAGNRT